MGSHQIRHLACLNVNGLRAAHRKGLGDWLAEQQPDVLCMQEIKGKAADLQPLTWPEGYRLYPFPADKPGYSGTGLLSRVEPDELIYGLDLPAYDAEGRVQIARFADLHLINAYFPSGTTGDARQAVKERFMDDVYAWVANYMQAHPKVLFCGDFNICHTAKDIHDPVRNKNVSGFLPHERAWMTKLLDLGFTDTLRHFTDEPDIYTWWTYRANAKANNKGWRIDYILSHGLDDALAEHTVHPELDLSDHCPLAVRLK